jgi:hypothetical protein
MSLAVLPSDTYFIKFPAASNDTGSVLPVVKYPESAKPASRMMWGAERKLASETKSREHYGFIAGFKLGACGCPGAVVGISCAILIVLFLGQRYGTSKVGFTFAPIVFVWFASNVMINLYNIIVYYPGMSLEMFICALRSVPKAQLV